MNATIHNTSPTDSGLRVRLGVLQAGRAPEALLDHHADYDRMFENLLGADAFDYRHFPVLDNVFPNNIDDADAWLITGSRFGAYEDHTWIPPLEAFIREVYASGKPMVGICFGHQIIAQALGGKVEKFAGGWSVGRVEYDLDESVFGPPASNTADSSALMAFHQDQVVSLPAEAKNVGSSSFCQNAALLYGNRMLTLQPHPEFDKSFIQGLLDVRGEILPDEVKTRAAATLEQPIAQSSIAQTLRHFLSRQTS
ncbi:type 1 glutamine amidotransferase [Granulosicoccus antarcticus]|nr:type 1 glutamine amidotransferase [Granulosicoccus antarcticus]